MRAEVRTLTLAPVTAGRGIRLQDGSSLLLSGIGSKKAERAANELVKQGAGALLSWGCAAGLVPELAPGMLVLPRVIIGADHSDYPVDPAWRKRLLYRIQKHIRLYQGALAETKVVLDTEKAKQDFFLQTSAGAADMESAAVAAVAKEAGIPFMAIRAIADSLDIAVPKDFLTVTNAFGKVRFWAFFKAVSRHPVGSLGLFRLIRSFRAAQSTLRKVVHLTGNNLLLSEAEGVSLFFPPLKDGKNGGQEQEG